MFQLFLLAEFLDWLPMLTVCMIFLVELLGSAPDLTDRLQVNALVDSVASTEDQVTKTRTTVGKFWLILSDLYMMMFPCKRYPLDSKT